MIVMLPCLPDPTDVVVQGWSPLVEMTWPKKPPVPTAPLALIPIVAGEASYTKMTGDPVPRALIGQSDWYGILPREIGPMRISGGEIVMQKIGATPLTWKDIFVDPIQGWLTSTFPIDKSGFILCLTEPPLGAQEPIAQPMLRQPIFPEDPVVTIPRGAVYRSGSAKRITAPNLPASLGSHLMDGATIETTSRWFLSGVTKDGTGTPMVSCRVVAMQADKVVINIDQYANPIVADIVSSAADGSYLIQVNNGNSFWLISSKSGSPDKTGATLANVTPVLV